ncbi:hypothetical protein HYDPIDRAFT_34087 [Hydnomerulius pinastri MD-312]|uniref:Uncharacterized protein n=1 Tax=Hydnomerulius pinastri MD-312 TaxID=994086 RepID=A0A0C9W6T7_9AGAM|nr:hypothetical protein HYDPIDRAFT_34087 [Hydnomerulius pinastri MD-312]
MSNVADSRHLRHFAIVEEKRKSAEAGVAKAATLENTMELEDAAHKLQFKAPTSNVTQKVARPNAPVKGKPDETMGPAKSQDIVYGSGNKSEYEPGLDDEGDEGDGSQDEGGETPAKQPEADKTHKTKNSCLTISEARKLVPSETAPPNGNGKCKAVDTVSGAVHELASKRPKSIKKIGGLKDSYRTPMKPRAAGEALMTTSAKGGAPRSDSPTFAYGGFEDNDTNDAIEAASNKSSTDKQPRRALAAHQTPLAKIAPNAPAECLKDSSVINTATSGSGRHPGPTNDVLPHGTQWRFKCVFLPIWRAFLGTLENPWNMENLLPFVQEIWDRVFDTQSYDFDSEQDEVYLLCMQRAYEWCGMIAKAAYPKYNSLKEHLAFIMDALGPDLSFIYRNSDVAPDGTRTFSGAFMSPLILHTFLAHIKSTLMANPDDLAELGNVIDNHPCGMLVLSATAIEQALTFCRISGEMQLTGNRTDDSFSDRIWGTKLLHYMHSVQRVSGKKYKAITWGASEYINPSQHSLTSLTAPVQDNNEDVFDERANIMVSSDSLSISCHSGGSPSAKMFRVQRNISITTVLLNPLLTVWTAGSGLTSLRNLIDLICLRPGHPVTQHFSDDVTRPAIVIASYRFANALPGTTVPQGIDHAKWNMFSRSAPP